MIHPTPWKLHSRPRYTRLMAADGETVAVFFGEYSRTTAREFLEKFDPQEPPQEPDILQKLREKLAACEDELREELAACEEELAVCEDELREELSACEKELREARKEIRQLKDRYEIPE